MIKSIIQMKLEFIEKKKEKSYYIYYLKKVLNEKN
jgi:hypothetical protein